MQFTKEDEQKLLQNSIERVINTTIQLLEFTLQYGSMSDEVVSLADINLQDWKALKSIVVNMWNDARNEVFKKRHEENHIQVAKDQFFNKVKDIAERVIRSNGSYMELVAHVINGAKRNIIIESDAKEIYKVYRTAVDRQGPDERSPSFRVQVSKLKFAIRNFKDPDKPAPFAGSTAHYSTDITDALAPTVTCHICGGNHPWQRCGQD